MLRTATALGSLLLTVSYLSASVGVAPAATFTVDSTADAVDALPGDSICATVAAVCSLRAAVQEANATAGPDTIIVGPGSYLLDLPGTDEVAATDDLDLTEEVTIIGAGADASVVSGGSAFRVFQVLGPIAVSMSGLAIVDGASDYGGGIVAAPSSLLSLTDVRIEGNYAEASGGGLLTVGALDLVRVVVASNVAAAGVGGLHLLDSAVIRDSAFYGNEGFLFFGGSEGTDIVSVAVDPLSGPFADGTINITNSTFAGAIGTISGCFPYFGGYCIPGAALNLRNVTAQAVHRIWAPGAAHDLTRVRNSIIFSCGGILESEGYNLFESSDCTIIGDPTGDVINTPALLHPLGDYGGPTMSRPPTYGSPAVDAANPAAPGSGGVACEATDQRLGLRPFGARCDIGAVERRCGDGVVQGDEECDDANAVEGDGCDSNCTYTACGNGIVTSGEACDDGNGVDGDCCSNACVAAAAGLACSDDSLCSSGDTCDAFGVCVGTFCHDCYACDPAVGCVVPGVCEEAYSDNAKLQFKHGSTDASDKLRIKWKRSFVDPLNIPVVEGSALKVCVYDANDEIVYGGSAVDGCVSTGDCWTSSNSGFRYKDKSRLPDGLSKARLKGGNGSRLSVVGKGPDLALPSLPIALPVQFRAFNGFEKSCYAAQFVVEQKNSASEFKAKSP